MKIRTRLAIAFVTITVVPIVLIFVAAFGLVNYQEHLFQKTYGLSEQIDLLSGNQTQVFNRLTQGIQEEIREAVGENTDLFEEPAYLSKVNEELRDKYSYLVIRKGKDITFCGSEDGRELCERLAPYGDQGSMAGSIYMDGEEQHLVKQIDFRFSDDSQGSVFIVTNVGNYVPEIKALLGEMLLLGVLIISFMGGLLIMWIYRSLLRPLHKLQEATKQIRDGNLDFTLDVDDEDEIGMLCQDFEEMRLRLKESQEEKLQYDKESKELISNISHDLKTPITAIKGYVEGIQDGVASSPEKLNKYIRTIYNKANDMDRLIDELTFYSKIDTNKIPYNFSKINVAEYFGDCVEEVGLDMETRHHLARTEWFRDIIVRAQSQTADLVNIVLFRRYHDDRCVFYFPDLLADLEAIDPWQHQIKNQKVKIFLHAAFQSRFSIIFYLNLKTRKLQIIFFQLCNTLLVFYD